MLPVFSWCLYLFNHSELSFLVGSKLKSMNYGLNFRKKNIKDVCYIKKKLISII